MVNLTFFGGVNEIGGNKFLVEDRDTKIFLDFGMSFFQSAKYYAEFLQPRACNGIGDLINLGIIPDMQGIYRNDLLANESRPLTEKPVVDAVFLSHAHADHSWHVSLLHPDIPIHCGFTTKLMLQAAQETSRGMYYEDFYFYRECFKDRFTKPKQVRNFKTFRTGEIVKVKDIEVEPIHVDHSIPGAYGFLVHTSAGCIAYSGDIRFHGPKKEMTEDFIEAAKAAKPIALLLEGTNIDNRLSSSTEEQVYKIIQKAVNRTKNLVMMDFPIRDIDRLKTFFQASRKSNRRHVVSMKQAYLLELLKKEDKKLELPAIDEFDIFLNRSSWGRYEEKDYLKWQRPYLKYNNAVKAKDMMKNQKKYMLYLEFFDLNELIDIKPDKGSMFIHSLTEPFNEEMEIDFKRMMNWLNRFDIPLKHAHASGHADSRQLKAIAERIKPKRLYPIHTDKAEMFGRLIRRVKVERTESGKEIQLSV